MNDRELKKQINSIYGEAVNENTCPANMWPDLYLKLKPHSWLQSTINLLQRYGIEFEVKDYKTGLIHCRNCKFGNFVEYHANTGKIKGFEDKATGFYQLLKVLDYNYTEPFNRMLKTPFTPLK